MRLGILLGISFVFILLFVAPVPVARAQSRESFSIARLKWPHVFGKTGPNSLNWINDYAELADIKANGQSFILALHTPDLTALYQKLDQNQLSFIDKRLQSILYHDCAVFLNVQPHYTNPCPVDENLTLQATVLNDIDVYLHEPRVATSSGTIAFWILDDFPGYMPKTLELIKQKVAEAPAPFPRATICGFDSFVSNRSNINDPFVDNVGFFTNYEIKNFTPKACDIVMYYPYAHFKNSDSNPALTDWQMKTLLPYLLTKTKEQGVLSDPSWNSNELVWGAIAVAFGNVSSEISSGYLRPRYQDMLLQADSYCRAGASILAFYTWHDSFNAREGVIPLHELYNDPELRQGAKDSSMICQQYWNNTVRQGDVNGDGKIDQADYDLWSSYYNEKIEGGPADFNSDIKIDGRDYVLWLTQSANNI